MRASSFTLSRLLHSRSRPVGNCIVVTGNPGTMAADYMSRVSPWCDGCAGPHGPPTRSTAPLHDGQQRRRNPRGRRQGECVSSSAVLLPRVQRGVRRQDQRCHCAPAAVQRRWRPRSTAMAFLAPAPSPIVPSRVGRTIQETYLYFIVHEIGK